MNDLLRRRRAMMEKKTEYAPLYCFKDIKSTDAGTNTGLVLFQDDKSFTILTEYQAVRTATHLTAWTPWRVNNNYRNEFAYNFWDTYTVGRRKYSYFKSGEAAYGTIRRICQMYDSTTKRIKVYAHGYASFSTTINEYVPSSDQLIIAKTDSGNSSLCTVRSFEYYDKVLPERMIEDWLAETPTE